MRQIIPLLSSKYDKTNLKSASVQNLTNFYVENFPSVIEGRTPVCALPTPGLSLWLDLSGSQVRGMIEHKNNLYVVKDNSLVKIVTPLSTGIPVATTLGTLNLSSGQVRMAAVDDEIVVVEYDPNAPTAGAVWSYKVTAATFAAVSAGQFPDYVSSVVGYAGYFLYSIRDSKKVYVSNLNDGRTIGALSFFSANSFANNIVAIIAGNNYIYIMASNAYEVWGLAGAPIQPFIRLSGGIAQFGIISPWCYSVIGDYVYYIANDSNGFVGPAIAQGAQTQLLGQHDLTNKINGYSHNDKCYSWTDNCDGHLFFNTTFPLSEDSRGRTHTYDVSTGTWFERSCFNANGILFPTQDQHKANCHTSLYNMQLVGDYYSGKIFKLDKSVYTDDGESITRKIVTPHLIDREAYFSAYNLEVDVERSQGLDGTVLGSDPQIVLRYSKDRGHTWSNESWRSASRLGFNNQRLRWNSLGGGRCLTIELTMSDPINWTIVNATVEIEKEEPDSARMNGLR